MNWRLLFWIVAWVSGCFLASRIDPTAVQLYLTVSIFAVIIRNLGTRREGLSAYSVFNRGGTTLLGQLQPEQFDNEIRHRPM